MAYTPTPEFREYLFGPNFRLLPEATTESFRPKPRASSVNKVSEQNERIRKQTILASDAVAPIVFGRDRFFAKLFLAHTKDDFLYAAFLVSHGHENGIEGYNAIYIDGIDVTDSDGFLSNTGAQINDYVGDQTQTTDPLLSAAISGFNSAYKGFAYIVLKIPNGATNGFPRVEVDVNGLKIRRYDAATFLEETGSTAGERNFIKQSLNLAHSDHVNFGTTRTETGNDFGRFKEVQLAKAGFGLMVLGTTTNTGVNQYAYTIYYKYGTSQQIILFCSNATDTLNSIVINNEITGLTVTDISAGTIDVLQDEDLGAFRVLRFVFTPYDPDDSFAFYIAPDLVTDGKNVFLYGLQVESADAVNNGTPEFTENPINIDSFLMTEKLGWDLDFVSARRAACWNNDNFPQAWQPRRCMGITFEKPTKVATLVENIRAYTGCTFAFQEGKVHFVEFKERDTSHTFGVDDLESIQLTKKNSKDIPTKVIVEYTDVKNDFKKAQAIAQHPDLETDPTIPLRISRVNMLGTNNYGIARREAIERYNYGAISDLGATLKLFDKGVKLLVGDVCEITYPALGLASKKMFVTSLKETSAGDWEARLEEYDELLFSSVVESDPTYPDTVLPIHAPPPQVQNIILTEEVYERRNGEYDNRIKVSWDQSSSPYARGYVVRFKLGGEVIASMNETGLQTAYGPVKEGVLYTVEVVAVTSLYEGTANSATIEPVGKFLIPSDVPSFTGFEVGGEVRLSWEPAIDLDIKSYEVRYGASGVTWANSILIDRTATLRLITKDIPAGNWDFLIKARDSVAQYSTNEKRINLEVTLDDSTLLVDSGTYPDDVTNDLLTHRTQEVRNGSDVIYTDTSGETWDDLFGGSVLPNVEPLAYYQTVPLTNFRYRSDEIDIGYNVSGDWRVVFDWDVYRGAAEDYLNIADSTNYPTFTEYSVNSVKAKAQYTYAEFRGLGIVRIDTALQTFRIDAVTRKESGESTAASGGKEISLENLYSAYKNITATPLFTGTPDSFYCVIDNVDLASDPNTFDVYMYDETGTEITAAQPFLWSFEGV